jgi:hypothetical protein
MESHETSNRRRFAMWLLVAAVWGWAIFLSVAPFGFDKPSRWGLDFEDAIASWLLMGILLVAALVTAHMERSSTGLLLLLAPILLGFLRIAF